MKALKKKDNIYRLYQYIIRQRPMTPAASNQCNFIFLLENTLLIRVLFIVSLFAFRIMVNLCIVVTVS